MEDDEITQIACCVLTDEFGRLLLLHRVIDELGAWEVPGGKVETEELPEMAAVREAREELGVNVHIVKPLGNQVFDEGDEPVQFHWFLGEIIGGEPSIMEPELFDDLYFLDLDDIMSLSLSVGMQLLLEKIWTGEVDLQADSV